ncbi:MAG TPA: hypothetical protein VD767_09380 [Thermomicrobiales bacterium]|nr:hypothetical protein [Thermomicrobiales bacterium]
MKRSLLVLVLVFSQLQGSADASTDPCFAPGTVLVENLDGEIRGWSPSGVPVSLPGTGTVEMVHWRGRQIPGHPGPHRWDVARDARDGVVTLAASDALTDEVVYRESFTSRIELAASTVSPSRRYAVYLQGNNIASELTVLDARTGTAETAYLAHNADLAPFAIGFAFRPGEACLAVTLERANGPGPETWLIDLNGLHVSQVSFGGAFVDRWLVAP